MRTASPKYSLQGSGTMTQSNSAILLICLCLILFTCLPGCDQPYETDRLTVEITYPPDAENAIIHFGSGFYTIAIEKIPGSEPFPVSLDIIPGETNELKVNFENSQKRNFEKWEVTDEIHVEGSGRTEVILRFVLASEPYISVRVDEGLVGTNITVEGWNFSPGEEIIIELGQEEANSNAPGHFLAETTWGNARLQREIEHQSKAPGENRANATELFRIPHSEDTGDNPGHFKGSQTVQPGKIVEALRQVRFIYARGTASGFKADHPFSVLLDFPYIHVNPDRGSSGAEVTLEAWNLNFQAGEEPEIYFDEIPASIYSHENTDRPGQFKKILLVPKSENAGTTFIRVKWRQREGNREDEKEVRFPFTITKRSIEVEPGEGAVSDEITVKGENFVRGEDIQIDFGGMEDYASKKVDEKGDFSIDLNVPPVGSGKKSIRVKAPESEYEAELEFTIPEPRVEVDPQAGAHGTMVTLQGTGFAKRESVKIELVSTESGDPDTGTGSATEIITPKPKVEVEAEDLDEFSIEFSIPSVEQERQLINVQLDTQKRRTFIRVTGSESGYIEEARFYIPTPFIDIEPLSGIIGTEITVTGQGFCAGEEIEIRFGDTVMEDEKADTDGHFETTFKVPGVGEGEEGKKAEKSVLVAGRTSGYRLEKLFTVPASSIELQPPMGASGVEITVTGSNFGAGEQIQIDLMRIEDNEEIVVASAIAESKVDASGGFKTTFTVPENAPTGRAYIIAKGQDSTIIVKSEFSISRRHIIVVPTSGVIYSEVTVIGASFAPSNPGKEMNIRLYFDDKEVASIPADESGSFEVEFTVPESDSGMKAVKAEEEGTGKQAEFLQFIIPTPSVLLPEPSRGPIGTQVTIEGRNFAAEEEIKIDFMRVGYDIPVKEGITTAKADALGNFNNATFIVPENAPTGQAYIRLMGQDSGIVRGAYLEVSDTPISRRSIDLYPESGPVNSEVRVTGTGFSAEKEILIYFGDSKVGETRTDISGSFGKTVQVPIVDPGNIYHIRAVEQESSDEATAPFTVLD
jgi:hypothetical protein